MRRRELMAFLAGSAVSWPLRTRAQVPASGRPLIAYLAEGTQWNASRWIGFLQEGLQALGYADGRNIDFIARFADGQAERLPGLAEELVQLKPKVIVAGAGNAAVALRKATATIPIVCPFFDAERLGLVTSLARPGGNVTGITAFLPGLVAKQLQLAREVVPGAARVGLLGNMNDPVVPPQQQEVEEAARSLKVTVIAPEVRNPEDIEGAIQALARERVDVVIALITVLLMSERRKILPLMAAHRLAVIYFAREFVDDGGLISYGVDNPWCFRRAAMFVDKILKGALPADLPVEFPTKLEMVINLKTAKALGITIPPLLFARADEVIE